MKGGLDVRIVGTTVVRLVTTPPIAAKVLPGPVLMLVGSAAGLLAGDSVHLRIDLAAESRLTVRTTAATIAHPCTNGRATTLEVDCRLGDGARLAWLPEPLIACAGCRHYGRTRLTLGAEATVSWLETVTLGRTGEVPGQIELRLDADLDGRPLLREGLRLDGGSSTGVVGVAGWDGPAVLGGHRHVGTLHLLGRRLPAATPGVMQLAGPGTSARLLAHRGDQLASRVAAALPPFLHPFFDPGDTGNPGDTRPAEEAVHV
ncbi:MAG: urease accessory protein UreD [Actinomycetota bacterium]|nr:urease accessory protein UreD [Actinomycetota bacterium]